MRTSRSFLAGVAMLTTVVATSGAAVVAAQDETGTLARADAVAGSIVWMKFDGEPTVTMKGGVQRTEGSRIEFAAITNDRRADGTLTLLGESRAEFPGPMAISASPVELVNDEGRWSGELRGGYERTMGWQLMGFLEGEGAYEGLTYLLHAEHDFYDSNNLDTHGVIFSGGVPGMTEQELPAE